MDQHRRRQPRHCMVVDNTWPDIRVEREARALVAAGYEVDVICLADDGRRSTERRGALTIHRLPVRRQRGQSLGVQLREYLSFLARSAIAITRLFARRSYDSVQVHNVPDFLVFAAVIPRLRGTPVILDLHDLMPEFFASRFPKDLVGRAVVWAVRLQERLATRFASHVITVTDQWRRNLVRRGIPEAKVSVVMNLPDHDLIQARDGRLGGERQDEVFTLIYHGTLTYRYGVDLALRAVAEARKRIPIRFVIHGRGEYLEQLRRLAADLGVEESVVFSTSWLPTEELPALITTADVGVVPYRRDVFTDGILPTKLMEYAALGVPAIAARTPVIADYFDSEMVEFFEPGDVHGLTECIVRLRGDPAGRATLAAAARRFGERYAWRNEATRYVRLVDALRRDGRHPDEMEAT